MTTFNFINTEALDQATVARMRAIRPVSDASLALGLVMPSGNNDGQRAKTGAFKREGVTSFELGCRCAWRDGGNVYGTSNSELADAIDTVGYNGKPNPRHDRKLNNIRGLHRQGLITVYVNGVALPRGWAVAKGPMAVTLTEHGLAWVKATCPDLYREAKAYSESAYEKALKAATAKPRKAKAEKAVDDTTAETEMPVEVEATPVDIQPPVADTEYAVEVNA